MSAILSFLEKNLNYFFSRFFERLVYNLPHILIILNWAKFFPSIRESLFSDLTEFFFRVTSVETDVVYNGKKEETK